MFAGQVGTTVLTLVVVDEEVLSWVIVVVRVAGVPAVMVAIDKID